MSSSSFKLSVPHPCFNKWEDMHINREGRYCTSCNKTVTDFTLFTDEEIKTYFINNIDKKICGRFQKKQLKRLVIHIPGYVLQKRIPAWKKFLLIFLICFGSSVLPIEIAGYHYSGLYAQTIVKVPNRIKKKKYKLKNKRSKYVLLAEKYGNFTFGITSLMPEKLPPYGIFKTNDSLVKNTEGLKISEDGLKTNNTNKIPGKEKNPAYHFEAMLPVLSRRKQRNRKNKIR